MSAFEQTTLCAENMAGFAEAIQRSGGAVAAVMRQNLVDAIVSLSVNGVKITFELPKAVRSNTYAPKDNV